LAALYGVLFEVRQDSNAPCVPGAVDLRADLGNAHEKGGP